MIQIIKYRRDHAIKWHSLGPSPPAGGGTAARETSLLSLCIVLYFPLSETHSPLPPNKAGCHLSSSP